MLQLQKPVQSTTFMVKYLLAIGNIFNIGDIDIVGIRCNTYTEVKLQVVKEPPLRLLSCAKQNANGKRLVKFYGNVCDQNDCRYKKGQQELLNVYC